MIKQALILAGGRGSRLGSLTQAMPKPMLPVAGKPFIEYLIYNLRRFGINRIVLSVGYLHSIIESRFQDGRKLGVSIDYSIETVPLGTGGGVRNALNLLDDTFLVLNGDTLFDCNYLDLAVMLSPDTLAAIALRRVQNVFRYGSVCVGGDRVLQFVEKGNSGPGLINAGVYALTRNVLFDLPEGCSSIEKDLFPLLAARNRLAARIYTGFFIDIGLPETLAEANRAIPNWMVGLSA
jgi:D-glycero-D-manno-heptose 1,7-bisphosphate phosphatase